MAEGSEISRLQLAVVLVLLGTTVTFATASASDTIQAHNVQQWAKTLGMELWWFGKYVTRRDELLHKYKLHAEIQERSGSSMVQNMASEIKNMMDLKISAVKRIMDAAENTAMSHHDDVVKDYEYWNAKLMVPEGEGEEPLEGGKAMVLTRNPHFYNVPVNLSVSSVHVPTNVFDKAPDVLRAIKWSENLDNIFTNNYRMDPSLSWQYFGSSYGFMRQYPAIQWKQEPVDLYDCRTRSWYIEAATSAKDIVILVDFSGSMTGMRKEIARHVVNNILDTLGNNDFVNIFTFSEETHELIPCFRDTLVQATLGNVREIKLAMEDLETKDIANFTSALTRAFELLQYAREERQGSMCNQAIMMVTDGVPFSYREVYEEFNWKDLPYMPVRIFTYLIGREVADVTQVKWMACANQGYYVHLKTLAEVREQVLQYIQVMARPMVLRRTDHPVIWTPVYADVTDPKMTDWLWEEKECEEQKDRYESFRKNRRKFNSKEEQDKRFVKKLKRTQNQSGDLQRYQLMTSVSMPVFDRRDNATKVANLLGVAGTDVPLQDILKLMSPHLLGVNGYAFIITNNGFVLTHPDLRPVFQGILKPSYNSVDMSEVELMDTEDKPREVSPAMMAFRDAVINQSTGSVTLNTKFHFDDMRRVSRMRRHYYYTGIVNTPFTLVLSLPEMYGTSRVHGMEEIRRSIAEGTQVMSYFRGKNWRVHPDWIYCKYHYDTEHPFDSAEQELIHFLERAQKPGWHWPYRRVLTPPERQGEPPARGGRTRNRPPPTTNATDGKAGKVDKDSYFCDRQLFLSLLFDAKITDGFSQNFTASPADDQGKELKEQLGITVSFISTHTGLTRWHDYPLSIDVEDSEDGQFSEQHNRAIDELWYKRAVEQHFVQPESFVYSVPHEAGYHNDTLVTASHALFLNSGERRAPAAVVGFQFLQAALFNRFMNVTSKCVSATGCRRTCASLNVGCYLLDNHGYVILSKNLRDTGHFFGEIQGYVMQTMVDEGIYHKLQVYDYQAVCFKGEAGTNDAPGIRSRHVLAWMVDWILGHLLWVLVQTNLQHLLFANVANAAAYASEDVYQENYEDPNNMDENRLGSRGILKEASINRTRPQPCDQQVELFQLQLRPRPPGEKTRGRGGGGNNQKYDPNSGCNRPFLVELVDASNMLLVVVDNKCDIPEMEMSVVPMQVDYNNSLSCHKLLYNVLPRKRLAACINRHPKENEITICGRGSPMSSPTGLFIFLVACLLAAR